jgi:hypothetical protein
MSRQRKSLQYQKNAAIGLMIIGGLLLLVMIITEDEPGALPLAMIAAGGSWLFINRNKLLQ